MREDSKGWPEEWSYKYKCCPWSKSMSAECFYLRSICLNIEYISGFFASLMAAILSDWIQRMDRIVKFKARM